MWKEINQSYAKILSKWLPLNGNLHVFRVDSVCQNLLILERKHLEFEILINEFHKKV